MQGHAQCDFVRAMTWHMATAYVDLRGGHVGVPPVRAFSTAFKAILHLLRLLNCGCMPQAWQEETMRVNAAVLFTDVRLLTI